VTVAKIITLIMLVASVVVCVPMAYLAFALLVHAPNQAARPFAFLPSILLLGAWLAVLIAWKSERWLIAYLVLATLLGIFSYGWSTIEVP
jgi:hypothetical protein